MAGIKHPTTTRATKEEYEKAHEISEYFDVAGGASIPAAPAAGSARQYVKINGTTPNRNIKIGYLLEDGTDIVLADVTI